MYEGHEVDESESLDRFTTVGQNGKDSFLVEKRRIYSFVECVTITCSVAKVLLSSNRLIYESLNSP
jgi:hypothetical protein